MSRPDTLTGDVLVAVESCGCILSATCADEAITPRAWIRKFYRDNQGCQIKRIPSSEYHGLDVCPHLGTPDPQRRLFA